MKHGHVYFVKPIGMDGPIKVGFSIEPLTRLSSFSTWSPFPLEIIGMVAGDLADETFLHQCFSHLHTHREWFLSSKELRQTIQTILAAGTVDVVRDILIPKDGIKNRSRGPRSPEVKLRTSYKMRIEWAQKRLRAKDEEGAWHAPDDVVEIMHRWSPGTHTGLDPIQPTAKEIERLEEYLSDPDTHSVIPSWRRNVVSFPAKEETAA